MSQHLHQTQSWLADYKDYLSGGLFALLIIDLGMFFAHCLIELTPEGYSLSSLIFIIAGLALFHIEKLYSEQDEH